MSDHQPELTIDGLMAELVTLAQISEAEPPVVTRVVFSEADMRARAYVKSLCAKAGLDVREDAIGNTFARWQGSDPDLAPIGTGSHIDAIPNAGSYDGVRGRAGRPGSDSRAARSWDSSRGARSSWSSLPPKSRRASASAAWAAA